MACKTLSWRHFFLLAAITLAVFLPVLKAGLLNWDDQNHLYQNEAVLHFDIRRMFVEDVQGIYLPLTSLSFAVENAVFGLNPLVYHLNNLLLHFGVCALLMGFFVQLGASVRAAFLGALLFAVHPMHMESVAWITERKDVLYAFFYVLALRQWLAWVDGRKPRDLGIALVWGCLSLLAKPMAISLPLVLLLVEWFRTGSVRRIRWGVYMPFLALAAGIGWLTYMHHVRNPVGDIAVSGLIWIWTLGFYVWKFFLPFVVHPMYVLPTPVGIFEPAYLFSVLLAVALAWALIQTARCHRDRWLLWAAGVFFFSVFFLLKFDAHDPHLVADRFMYLPSLGVCAWLGIKADAALARYGRLALAIIVGIFILLGVRTFTYAFIWKDSITLWSHVIENYPLKDLGYNNRAVAYGEIGRYDLGVKDHTTVLTFPSNRALALYNRGLNYRDWSAQKLGQGDRAQAERLYRLGFADFDEAIRLDDHYARTYNHRGMARFYLGDMPGAIKDLTTAIEKDPVYNEAYNNRGNIRAAQGELDLALSDYRKAIELGAKGPEPYSNMGIIYARKDMLDLAIQGFDKAIAINPRHVQAYFNRAVVLRQKGDIAAARADEERARALGAVFPPGLTNP